MSLAKRQVLIQDADFDAAGLQARLLCDHNRCGAAATFTGYVRGEGENGVVESVTLEHYPGMTEKSIDTILQEAAGRWPLLAVAVVHRVGVLRAGEQIVWVGASSTHRAAAFAAVEFVMDYLKTQAPLWKKERGPAGDHWVEARTSDADRAERWR